jgi:predicted Zn-dependent peptidase
MGHLGVSRVIPDVVPASVLLGRLGIGMGSRINYRLREDKGYTYAAGFTVHAHRGAGPMGVLTSVETRVTADAVATVVAELNLMKTDGLSSDELRNEVDQMVGGFPVRYQTPAQICDALANHETWGYPSDWMQTYRDRLSALTLDEVNATGKHLHPERMATIVVGDADQVAEPLRQLDLAPVTVIEDEAPA